MSNTIGVNDLLAQMREMSSQVKGLQNSINTPNINGLNGINEKSTGDVNKTDTQNAFSSVLKSSINKVNDAQMQTNKLAEAFQKGDPNIQVSEVMIAMQKSNVSFQAMLQVRNKIIQAYQEIMNMPV